MTNRVKDSLGLSIDCRIRAPEKTQVIESLSACSRCCRGSATKLLLTCSTVLRIGSMTSPRDRIHSTSMCRHTPPGVLRRDETYACCNDEV